MITKKEVQHIAKLARLGFAKKEIKKFQMELSKILDYVEKLKEVDVSKVEATSHPLRIENVKRRDYLPAIHPKIEEVKKLLDLAPETKGEYLKIKSIFK